MFRHQGKRRTFIHNLRLATNLAFVAGIVNIVGVLSLATFTTNVTGHFAYFAEEIVKKDYSTAIHYILFIVFFLLGAFFSNLIIEIALRRKLKMAHAIPIFIEIVILTFVALAVNWFTITSENQHHLAYLLLFAMGLQNALVTQISQSTVRTTHFTGMFTDLGIELSQLYFYKKTPDFKKLTQRIYLRLAIILFFFLGCILGGFCYGSLQLNTLFIAVSALLFSLFYDKFIYFFHRVKRKSNANKK